MIAKIYRSYLQAVFAAFLVTMWVGVVAGTPTTNPGNQMSLERELGDPKFGLIATVLVLGTDQPQVPPQGGIALMPKGKTTGRRDLALGLLPKSDREPPRLRFQRYAIAVDGKPYQTTHIHPWALPSYNSALPYAPKSVTVTAYLSTGERYTATVDTPMDLKVDRNIDIRKNEVTRPSDGYMREDINASSRGDIMPPYRDQTGFRIYEFAGEGRGLNIATTCLSSEANGRIVHSRLTIKQHYFYSPGGDLVLTDTTFHQPVYGTDESVAFNSPLHAVFKPDGTGKLKALRHRHPDDRRADPNNPYPAKFVLECRTEKDKTLRREFEYRWKRIAYPVEIEQPD